jgi:hypothetical protein
MYERELLLSRGSFLENLLFPGLCGILQANCYFPICSISQLLLEVYSKLRHYRIRQSRSRDGPVALSRKSLSRFQAKVERAEVARSERVHRKSKEPAALGKSRRRRYSIPSLKTSYCFDRSIPDLIPNPSYHYLSPASLSSTQLFSRLP